MDFISSSRGTEPAAQVDAAPAMTKYCKSCAHSKPIAEFALKNPRTGQRHSKCKACQRAYAKTHYEAKKAEYIDRASKRNRRVKDDYYEAVTQYLADKICLRCRCEGPLLLYRKPDYDGLPVHEVIRRKGAQHQFDEALRNSDVFCQKCLGQHFAANLLPHQFGNDYQQWMSFDSEHS